MRDDMFRRALGVRDNAYAPYSRFTVGCCLRAESGKLYDGCNVENAAYPQGQCAEANAVGAMIAAGERAIAAVALVGGDEDLCTPCGGCRQRRSRGWRAGLGGCDSRCRRWRGQGRCGRVRGGRRWHEQRLEREEHDERERDSKKNATFHQRVE